MAALTKNADTVGQISGIAVKAGDSTVAYGMALVAGRPGVHSARIGRQGRQHGDQENTKLRRLSYERFHDTPPAHSGLRLVTCTAGHPAAASLTLGSEIDWIVLRYPRVFIMLLDLQ